MSVNLSDNARRVLEARYLRRSPSGGIAETPEQLFRRVARAVASAEAPYLGKAAARGWEEAFFEVMASLDFLPNSPTLMNAGTPLGQLSACFVLPVDDSLPSIFDALKLMALIQQSGGGTGFSFSRLRPKGDIVASTGGPSSGPVSFMHVFDAATESIHRGGRRRGANMGVLRVDHPDILEFVEAKLDGVSLSNFNLSVAVTDAFMESVLAGRPFPLRHPRTGEIIAWMQAADVFASIARSAWKTGDPGLLFVDAVNRANPTPEAGTIEATNPCGEVPLLPYEACNLGSMNLSHMVRYGPSGPSIDWDKLDRVTRLAMRFLDDVIDIGRFPDPRIHDAVKANRKVGLGVMGYAEMLILLGIPYASPRAESMAEEIMQFVSAQATIASEQLAAQRGPFPGWARSAHARTGRRLRNATCTSIAPTGTISILAGTSASIEPLFALAYRRPAPDGGTLLELNRLFVEHARDFGLPMERISHELQVRGSLTALTEIPAPIKELFQTALEIPPEDHLRIQAAFQRHVDNAVSKTVNLPEQAQEEDVVHVYRRAFELGLKGVTVYRYGSKAQQVLTLGTDESALSCEHFARCDPHACRL